MRKCFVAKNYFLVALFGIVSIGCNSKKPDTTTITVVGAMRNVMMKGELQGTISLDTIQNNKHLYGLGPIEYLSGEILIVDGHAYQSKVVDDATMQVEESFTMRAPFFVYANVNEWHQHKLPDSIKTHKQLESFLDQISKTVKTPFAFKLEGDIETANIHVVNLPTGSIVRSPQDAHQGQVNYKVTNEPVEIIGFFSRKHKSIFTHHDSFVHMHLITGDKKMMGHLDGATFKKEKIQLWISF